MPFFKPEGSLCTGAGGVACSIAGVELSLLVAQILSNFALPPCLPCSTEAHAHVFNSNNPSAGNRIEDLLVFEAMNSMPVQLSAVDRAKMCSVSVQVASYAKQMGATQSLNTTLFDTILNPYEKSKDEFWWTILLRSRPFQG